MLTGHRLFEGETISDTLAAVLTKDVDWSRLPATTPSSIRQMLRRCLERDPTRRLRDIGEARIVLGDPSESPTLASTRRSAAVRADLPRACRCCGSRRRHRRVCSCGFLAAAAGERPVTVFQIGTPERLPLALVNRPAVSISQDGGTIVFVARRDGIPRLFVKRVRPGRAAQLDGTEGATGPVLSPDGRRIAFIANARLRLVDVDGGAVTDVMTVNDARGHAWRDDARLIVSAQPVARR